MRNQIKNKNFWAVLVLDIILLVFAHYCAYFIRFEGKIYSELWFSIEHLLPILVLIKLSIFFVFGLYRGVWRYTSLVDLLTILKASVASFFMIAGFFLFVHRFEGLSRSVFILDGIFTFIFIAGSRVAIRMYFQGDRGLGFLLPETSEEKSKKRLLIIGAGDAGEKVVREINDNRELPYRVSGFLDDNPELLGRSIHGIPILGNIEDLLGVAETSNCQEILIAMPSAARKDMERIVALCQKTNLPFKTLPGMGELIDGKISIKAIRDVSYKDLLGRPPVRLELARIENILRNKTILITGAGGSIGSELCRQILRFNPGQMILFDAGEENLYRIEMEMRHDLGFENYVTVLGKVQDEALLERIFSQYKPEVVFHAAAYKHVPLVEQNPWEAVSNNILASKYLMEAVVLHSAARFILVSTDKAVRPTNVMGASKRVIEILMQGLCKAGERLKVKGERLDQSSSVPYDDNVKGERERLQEEDYAEGATQGEETPHSLQYPLEGCSSPLTRMMAVRFGNVLGSSGSVIPLFRRQIEMGGPVTVTDPKITRYFMSIEEAAQLILQACSLEDEAQGAGRRGKGTGRRAQGTETLLNQTCGGEIFILEMGTPIKINQMARDLIRLCGKEPDTEIEIKYIGLRPGEKLYEELITQGEGIVKTGHEKIMVLRPDGHSAKFETESGVELLHQRIEELKVLAKAHDAEGIRRKLQEIVPEYTPKD